MVHHVLTMCNQLRMLGQEQWWWRCKACISTPSQTMTNHVHLLQRDIASFMLPPINTSHLCSFHGNHNKRQNIFCMLGIFYLINFYLARKLRKVLFTTLLFILSVQWIWMHKWRFTVTAAQYIFIWVSIWKNFLFNAIKLYGKQKQVLQANIFDIEARYDPNIR